MEEMVQNTWGELLRKHLVAGAKTALDKAEQQHLAVALQEWTATCILFYIKRFMLEAGIPSLEKILKKPEWEIHFQGKTNFLGATRQQEVDVWMSNPKAGLVLAVDPKHFQSKDSLNKNWKNGHNDLIAFTTNLHERFPLCAVGGVIAFPLEAATDAVLRQMYGICSRSIPRPRSINANNKFEGFALAPYGTNGELSWPFEDDSPLRPDNAFSNLAGAVLQRTLALL